VTFQPAQNSSRVAETCRFGPALLSHTPPAVFLGRTASAEVASVRGTRRRHTSRWQPSDRPCRSERPALYGSHLPAVPVPYSLRASVLTGRAEAHHGGPPPGRRGAASLKNITVVHHTGRLEQEQLTCLPKSFAKPAK
jgi:hypothetical protein